MSGVVRLHSLWRKKSVALWGESVVFTDSRKTTRYRLVPKFNVKNVPEQKPMLGPVFSGYDEVTEYADPIGKVAFRRFWPSKTVLPYWHVALCLQKTDGTFSIFHVVVDHIKRTARMKIESLKDVAEENTSKKIQWDSRMF